MRERGRASIERKWKAAVTWIETTWKAAVTWKRGVLCLTFFNICLTFVVWVLRKNRGRASDNMEAIFRSQQQLEAASVEVLETASVEVFEAAESLAKRDANSGIEGVRRGHGFIIADACLFLESGIGYVRGHSDFRSENHITIQSEFGEDAVYRCMNSDGMTFIDQDSGIVYANNVFAARLPAGSGFWAVVSNRNFQLRCAFKLPFCLTICFDFPCWF